MHRELLARGSRVGKERVRRLMQRHSIRAKGKRKFVVTTDSAHRLPVAPDLVQRRFTPAAPNMVWSGDITYIATDEGWLYLAAVLDLHSRQVVGWSPLAHVQTSLFKDALLMACFRRRPAAGLISQRQGHPVLQPGLPGHLEGLGRAQFDVKQRHLLGQRPYREPVGTTEDGLRSRSKVCHSRAGNAGVMDLITFLYNHSWLHSALGYLSPMQFQQRWLAAQRKSAA